MISDASTGTSSEASSSEASTLSNRRRNKGAKDEMVAKALDDIPKSSFTSPSYGFNDEMVESLLGGVAEDLEDRFMKVEAPSSIL